MAIADFTGHFVGRHPEAISGTLPIFGVLKLGV
jgi:hypothetical protein